MENENNSSRVNNHVINKILLAKIMQQHGYNLLADYNGVEVTRLTGPLDIVRWNELKMLQNAVTSGIVRTNLIALDRIEWVPSFSRGKEGWSPEMELWLNLPQPSKIERDKAKTMIELILVGLKRDVANNAPDMHTANLNHEEVAVVQEVICETLATAGGKKLSVPLAVEMHGAVFELDGKLGAKPSLANFQAVPVQLFGQFTGFDCETRELFFRTREKRLVMNYEPTLVNVGEIVHACMEKKECHVRTQKTIARNGAEVLAYIPDEPFKTAPF